MDQWSGIANLAENSDPLTLCKVTSNSLISVNVQFVQVHVYISLRFWTLGSSQKKDWRRFTWTSWTFERIHKLNLETLVLIFRAFGCNLDEAECSDLEQYSHLGQFFRRRLRDGCRIIDQDSDIVSPCDGKVLHWGQEWTHYTFRILICKYFRWL